MKSISVEYSVTIIARLYKIIIDEHNTPTGGMLERWNDLKNQFKELRKPYDDLIKSDVESFNELAKKQEAGKIILPLSNMN